MKYDLTLLLDAKYDMSVKNKNPHAVALGRRGGKARAQKTTPLQRKEWARLGGLARARKHSKQELSLWAKLGGRPPKRRKGGRS